MPRNADAAQTSHGRAPDKARRRFLSLLPVGIFAGMTATVAVAAFRFLRPPSAPASGDNWTNVAPLAELKGDKPIMRVITVEREAGWSIKPEERFVYVLPQRDMQVLTAACPHEGCNVSWREDLARFACPCHDSFFAPDGARLSGPARRGLDPLPTRESGGMLQVRYQSFVNNTAERVVRE